MYLNKNVYIVNGAVNAAIYDLNNGELYQISNEANTLITQVIENERIALNNTEQSFINDLIAKGIIVNEPIRKHDIFDLYEQPNIEFVWIEITNMCNLRCVHCYDEALCGSGKIMELSSFKHIYLNNSNGLSEYKLII